MEAQAQELTEAGLLRDRGGEFVLSRADDYPAARVALRSASADSFILIEAQSGEVLGSVEVGRAYATIHEGAVYLHMGRSYEVLALDLAARRALLEPFSGDYFTQSKRESMTFITRLEAQRATLGFDSASERWSTRRPSSVTSASACRTTR